MSRKVFIGIPCHTATISVPTLISIIVSIREILANGWEYPVFYFRVGDSDLCRARNVVVADFLASDCTDMVLIDSDISWSPGSITRLISHDKDFVAGSYRGKTDEKEVYFNLWPEKKELWMDPATGYPLLKVDGAPLGFCRIRRECVDKLVASLNGKYIIDPFYPNEKIPWLIDFGRDEDGAARLEEGYSLCRRWRDLGGDVWVDPMINLGHMGPKIFESNLMGFLEKMQSIARFNEPNEVQDRIEKAWLQGIPTAAE